MTHTETDIKPGDLVQWPGGYGEEAGRVISAEPLTDLVVVRFGRSEVGFSRSGRPCWPSTNDLAHANI